MDQVQTCIFTTEFYFVKPYPITYKILFWTCPKQLGRIQSCYGPIGVRDICWIQSLKNGLIHYFSPSVQRQGRQEPVHEIQWLEDAFGECEDDPETGLCCMIKDMSYNTIEKVSLKLHMTV